MRYLRLRHAVAAIGILLLCGCASFRGAPEPTTAADAVDPAVCPSNADVLAFYRADDVARGGLTPVQFRDFKISACIAAIDSKYVAFLKELRRQRIGAALGGDLAVLTLNGIAAVASEGTSNALAAASAGVVGSKAAVDKDLYFDQTLPALESTMAANRADVLARIRTQQSTDKYTLAEARSDVLAYQEAGNIDSAIKGLNASAAKTEAKATDNLTRIEGRLLSPAEIHRQVSMTGFIYQLESVGDLETLKQIATDLNLSDDAVGGTTAADYSAAIRVEIVRMVKAGKADTVLALVQPIATAHNLDLTK